MTEYRVKKDDLPTVSAHQEPDNVWWSKATLSEGGTPGRLGQHVNMKMRSEEHTSELQSR